MKIDVIGIRHVDFIDSKTNENVVGTSLYFLEDVPESEGLGVAPSKLFVRPNIRSGEYFDKIGFYDVEKWGNKIVKVNKL